MLGHMERNHFYRPQRSCCKVMFSQASVILFTGEGVWQTPPPPPGRHSPQVDTRPGRHPPPRDGYCSGRYVSYWNAFLLISASISGRLDSVDWVTGLSAAVNIFCAFLNLIRGMAIISHGHYDVSTHSHENHTH